jgi:hypothetical protein
MEVINKDYVKSWFTSYLGQPGINGSNCANESAHNAYSQGATEFGLINSKKQIGVGNNGKPLEWDSFINHFVHSRNSVGNRNNESGYWGVGGSKIFPIRFGVHDYVATKINGKYYKYEYIWGGFDKYSDFTGSGAVNSLESLSIERTEVSHDEYKKLVFTESFESEPTFFFNIRKYSDSNNITFSRGNIINSLNNTFHASRNVIKYFVEHEGKKVSGKRGYFPTTRNGEVIQNIEDLEKVATDVEVSGAKFDVYHYKYETAEYTTTAALEIKSKTDDYRNVFGPTSKASTPWNHFFNKERLHLTSVSLGSKELSSVKYNYSNCVFIQKDGSFKYSTVKSATIDEELRSETARIHKDYIDDNTHKQHKGNKGEDNKVLECFDEVITNGLNGGNILSSIQLLCGYKLTPPDIEDELNHLNFRTIKSREHDWAIKSSDSNEYTLNLEFMNNAPDWGHIDKLNFTIDEDGIPYHALIVDSYSKNKEKIQSFKQALENKNVPHLKKVWVVMLEDFVKFKKDRILKQGLIYDSDKISN